MNGAKTLPARQFGALAALAVAMTPLTAKAQWAVVESNPVTVQAHVANEVNTYTQKLQDYAEYYEQGQRWLQQLTKIQNMIANFGMPTNIAFENIPANHMVGERCGGGLTVGNLASAVGINLKGDAIQEQKKLCAQIVMLNNQKFNATIDFMRRTQPVMDKAIELMNLARTFSDSPGTIQGIQEQAVRYDLQYQQQEIQWRNQIAACDARISSLEAQQKILARTALRGSNNLVGTVVSTAALKAALEHARTKK